MTARLNRVRTNVLEIAYLEDGDANGAPVVLAHGFPDDASTWSSVAPALVTAGHQIGRAHV